MRTDTQVHPDTLLRWLQKQVVLYDKVYIEDIGASFKDGLAICAIIHRYRPDLIDFYGLNAKDTVKNNQLAFDILEKELNIPPVSILYFLSFCSNITNLDTRRFIVVFVSIANATALNKNIMLNKDNTHGSLKT